MKDLIIDPEINPEVQAWLKNQNKWTPKAFNKYKVKSGTLFGKKCVVIPIQNFNRVYILPTDGDTKGTWRSFPSGSGILGSFNYADIFLCEGEWDLFTLFENDIPNSATTTTGAMGFKEEFVNLFRGKSVKIVYDLDQAGKSGAIRAADKLVPVCKSVSIVDLPIELGDGGDVRDFFITGGTKNSFLNLQSINYKRESEFKNIVDKYPISLAPKPALDLIDILSVHTDAPKQFIVGAALSVLSTILGNSYTVLNGIHLNNYYLLVGKSGLSRKSTAQSIAEKIVYKISNIHSQHYSTDQTTESCKVSPFECISNFSVEGLEEALKGNGISVFLTPGEYKQVLEIAKRQGQGNTIPQLTSMWDLKPISFRSRTLQLKASDYCLTMLATSTKDWLSSWLDASNINGGFINRHNVIVADPVDDILIFPENIDDCTWTKIVNTFNEIVPIKKMSINNSSASWICDKKQIYFKDQLAKDIWIEYCTENHEKMRRLDDNLVDMAARETTHAIKLAGLKCVSEERDSITSDDLLFGMYWAQASTAAIQKLCESSGMENSSHNQIEDRLLSFFQKKLLEDKKLISKTDIGKHFGGDQTPFKKALIDLENKGRIVTVDGKYALDPNTQKYTNN